MTDYTDEKIEKLKRKHKQLEDRMLKVEEKQKAKLEYYDSQLRVINERVGLLKREFEDWRWKMVKKSKEPTYDMSDYDFTPGLYDLEEK